MINKSLKILQLNANHARTAMNALAQFLQEQKIDIALISDPLVQDQRLVGFPNQWRKVASKDQKAWIVMTSPDLKYSVLLASKHQCLCCWKLQKGQC